MRLVLLGRFDLPVGGSGADQGLVGDLGSPNLDFFAGEIAVAKQSGDEENDRYAPPKERL